MVMAFESDRKLRDDAAGDAVAHHANVQRSPAHARTRSGKISEVYTLVRVCQERGHQDEERLGGANRTGGAQEPVLARR